MNPAIILPMKNSILHLPSHDSPQLTLKHTGFNILVCPPKARRAPAVGHANPPAYYDFISN